MKWLTNVYDPGRKDARNRLAISLDQSRDEVWQNHLKWLSKCHIAEPQATGFYTVGQLKNMHMVGVYRLPTE